MILFVYNLPEICHLLIRKTQLQHKFQDTRVTLSFIIPLIYSILSILNFILWFIYTNNFLKIS